MTPEAEDVISFKLEHIQAQVKQQEAEAKWLAANAKVEDALTVTADLRGSLASAQQDREIDSPEPGWRDFREAFPRAGQGGVPASEGLHGPCDDEGRTFESESLHRR